jgi:hypothetical protein
MKVIALLISALLLVNFAYTTPTQEAIEVTEGILVGAFGDIGHEVKMCIKDGEEIFKDVESAVHHFENGSLEEVIAGLQDIAKALELLPEEVKDCEALPDLVKDIEKIIAEFANPEELIVHVGEEIFWHGVSIYGDVTDCVKQFQGHQYEPAGEDIGDIIKILFLELSLRDPVIDAEDFLEGFFKGALEDDSVEINDCITDATEVIEELEVIINDIKSGATSDIEKLFLDFIDLITDSVQSVAQCEKAPAEIDIMLGWAETMKDLKTMEHKLFDAFLYYPDRIKEDMKDMIDSFEDHTYSTSGFCMGDFLHVLFIDVQGLGEDYFDDASQFLTAFYSKAFNLQLDLSTCEADVQAEWALIEEIAEDFEHLDVAHIKDAVKALLEIMPTFIKAFDECEQDWPVIQQGLVALEPFVSDAAKLPWAITKACTTHFLRVEHDCSEVYHAFHDSPHNFANGGEGSGDLTALLLSELKLRDAENVLVQEMK